MKAPKPTAFQLAAIKVAFGKWTRRMGYKPVRCFSDFGPSAIGEARIVRRNGLYLVELCVASDHGYPSGIGFSYPMGVRGLAPMDFAMALEAA